MRQKSLTHNPYLAHYGIKGMHWGVRRYQDYDGTLLHPKGRDGDGGRTASKKTFLSDKQKKAIKIGATVAAGTLLAYGAHKAGLTKLAKTAFEAHTGIHVHKVAKGKQAAFKVLDGGKKAMPKKSDMKFDYGTGKWEVLGDPALKTTKVNGEEYIANFNRNFLKSKRQNCRQANSEFLCKKMGIDCEARAAEFVNGAAKTGLNPKRLFPQAKSDMFEVIDHLNSEKEFTGYIEHVLKNACGGKDGFGGMTIKLRKGMGHQLSWEIKDGAFRIINSDGSIGNPYYSTILNNVNSGLFQAGNIEFFKAEGPIDMDEVARQVIIKR